jgi:hypothetical protein
MKLVNLGDVYVERDALDIARKINEYDPNLRIQYLESEARIGEPPFRLVENCKDGVDRIVFTFWELDNRVLDRIYKADTHKQNILTNLDTANIVASLNEQARYKEKIEETQDIVAHIVASPKSKYKVGNTTYYDDRPAEVKDTD